MEKLVKVAVDAMGGDHAPGEVVKGAVDAVNEKECGCDRTVADPRMAAIQDIFKNFKEV